MLFKMQEFDKNLIDMIYNLDDEELEKLQEFIYYLRDLRNNPDYLEEYFEEMELNND